MSDRLLETGLYGLSNRFLFNRKARSILTILGVAFGVALTAAMTILGSTLDASIVEQLRQGFGTYDILVGYQLDRLMPLEEQERLRKVAGVNYTVGVLYLTPTHQKSRDLNMRFNYIGIGTFPAGHFAFPINEGRYPGAAEFVTDSRIAESLGIKIGDSVTLPFRTGPQQVRLSGLTSGRGAASSDSLIFHLPWLQQQMELQNQVTLMLIGLHDATLKDRIGADIRSEFPDVDIQLRKELDEAKKNMGGLKPVAIAFGIAGLFASAILVAGTFTISVQERAREWALLRSVGATAQQVIRLVLREATLLGLVGGAVGLLLGAIGASSLLHATAKSLGVQERPALFPWGVLLLEWAIGMILALAAAWKPAHAAGRLSPLEAMRPDVQRAEQQERVGGTAGLVLLLLGGAMTLVALFVPAGSGLRALLGAAGGLIGTVGLLLALPRLLTGVVSALTLSLSWFFSVEALIAGRSVLRHRKRSALTAATLVLGVALVTSMSTILGELSRNQDAFVRGQFIGDAQIETQAQDSLGTELASQIARVDGVKVVSAHAARVYGHLRGFDFAGADPAWSAEQVRIGGGSKEDPRAYISLVPVDPVAMSGTYDFGRISGKLDGGGLMLTEKQAAERGIRLGSMLTIQFAPTLVEHYKGSLPPGSLSYPVTAIVERLPFFANTAVIDRKRLPAMPDAVIFFTYEKARRDEVKAAVQQILRQPQYGLATLRDLAETLKESEEMVNQRWAILGAVDGVIFLVGALGLTISVTTGLHHRRRELATMRAIGSTPTQTTRQLVLEAMLLGLTGSLLGVLNGLLFTGSLIVGLGDSIKGGYPVELYLMALAIGPAIAIMASVLPARQVSKGSASLVLRQSE